MGFLVISFHEVKEMVISMKYVFDTICFFICCPLLAHCAPLILRKTIRCVFVFVLQKLPDKSPGSNITWAELCAFFYPFISPFPTKYPSWNIDAKIHKAKELSLCTQFYSLISVMSLIIHVHRAFSFKFCSYKVNLKYLTLVFTELK